MKKFILAIGLVLSVLIIKAQPPGPPSIEERMKRTNELLGQEVQLTNTQKTVVESAFKTFFTAEDQLRKDNPPPPPPPPDPKVKAAMDKLVKERDEKIKEVLTGEQFKQFKEAEMKMHPPKPPAGGQRPGAPSL